MAKMVLKVQTPVGEFNRSTKTAYTHAVVRESERAMGEFKDAQNGGHVFGVGQRWAKDRGYAVTWHGSEKAAKKAAEVPYMWDRSAKVVGVFPVEA
jgi:hypothetical protein